jgi:hypothetical protein
MRRHHLSRAALSGAFALLLALVAARPALAQDPAALQTLRGQYNALMADLDRLASASGDTVTAAKVGQGRAAMAMVSDEQLAEVYRRTRIPDLSVATRASRFLARRAEALSAAGTPAVPMSAGFPDPVAIPAGCVGVDVSGETRYAMLIAKEVTNSILAAATFVCNTSILGVNTSLACVPLAIAADIANGLFNTATFCAGEVTANQIDANFYRLDHLHTDLSNAITTIVNTSNANTTTIINNDNANTTAIVTNANTNTTTIVANDNANTAAILANAAANKNELRDLILRSQIEADLAMADGAAVVALYELPNAHGGYLDLVTAIVTETIADVLGAAGTVSNALAALAEANAAKAAGNFKAAYSSYRKAYKAAGR